MKKISISAELERDIRREVEKGAGSPLSDIVVLLDGITKRAAVSSAMGYRELVALFRSVLGSDLVTPPAASAGYIVRMVNKAREQGISKDNVEQIARGLRRTYPRGPYQLEFVIGRASIHFAAGRTEEEGAVDVRGIYTGRPDFEDP